MKTEQTERLGSRGSVRRAVILAFGTPLFWAGAAVSNLLALLFIPFAGKPSVRRRARIILRRLLKLWMAFLSGSGVARFELAGTENLEGIKGTVVVANHPTLMDALYLLVVIPDAVCIFKKSLQRNVLLGSITRLCGFVANEAGPDLIREAGVSLSEGCNVIIFPEGTRSRGALHPFKPGFALIAIRYRAPVQTIHLSCEPPLLPGRIQLKGIPRVCPLVTVRPGHLFQPRIGARATEFLADTEAYYRGGPCSGAIATLS